eukprot:scaffold45596_cov58-Attheya_sp.AAC.2
MSDLVQFVTSVLKEKVAVDLQDENEQLRKEVDELREERRRALTMAGGPSNRIEITGKGGTPVYASGNVYGAILDPAFCGRLLEFLPREEDIVCPISQMANAEIRLNGMRIGTVGTCEDSDDLTDEDGDYVSLYYQYFPSSHGVREDGAPP